MPASDHQDSEAWRELIDVERLAAWMDTQRLQQGPIEDAALLTGGTQNLLLHFRRGERWFVLRRPPPHPRLDGSGTMRREARVLAALAPTRVPHARLIASCDDQAVLGAGFYLMEPVDGFSPTVALPDSYLADPAYRHRMGLAMVDAIAELGRIEPAAAGLSDFGRLDGYLERQAGRWRTQLDGYRDYAGWPGPQSLSGADTLSAWLDRHRPARFQPGIIHGDYHLGNVMFRRDTPELAAIIDWELATLGDPLIDLGWLLVTWPDADGSAPVPKLEVRPWDGFATADELIARYAERSGRDLSDLNWYAVLACYKLGILLEGSYARACAGKAPVDVGEALHAAALKLFERAATFTGREIRRQIRGGPQ